MKSLRDIRLEKGQYQREVAKGVGASVSRVSQWESGTITPEPPMIPKLAKHFKVTAEEIVAALNESARRRYALT